MSDFPIQIHDGLSMTDTAPPGGHYHDLLEIGWCHEGSGIIAVDSRCFEFDPRSVFVIGSGRRHFAQSTRGNIAIWTFMYIDLKALLSEHVPDQSLLRIDDLGGPHFQHVMNEKSEPAICKVVSQMVAEFRMRQENWEEALRGLCRTLAVYLQRLKGRQLIDDQECQAKQSLAPALDRIHHEYANDISGEMLAADCALSLKAFQDLFQSCYQCSYQEFIKRRRMHEASDLLHHSQLGLEEIARVVAYDDEVTFAKAFEDTFASTPKAWRRGR